MNIVFLTNQYYPNAFANGICVHQIALSFLSEGHRVFVICYGDSQTIKKSNYQGVDVIQLPVKSDDLLRSGVVKSGKIFSALSVKVARFIGISQKLFNISKYPLKSKKLIDHFYEAAESIIKNYGIDRLVCTYTPVEAVIAGARIKERYNSVIIIYYSLDTLSNECGYGLLPEVYRRRKGIDWERSLFPIYDKIICPECHRIYYESEVFNKYKMKINFADFPLFKESNDHKKNATTKNIIIYAGTLYKKIRNPEYAINILLPVLNDNELHFYGSGDCNNILNSYKNKFPNKVFNHGYISHERVIEEIYSAKILLSIGNKGTQMAPSKIFEYMATGKPIIHVYFENIDPCIEPLLKYGNAIIIKYDETNNKELEEFIRAACDLEISNLKYKFINATPEYTCKIILS